jgi:hypothetical protein
MWGDTSEEVSFSSQVVDLVLDRLKEIVIDISWADRTEFDEFQSDLIEDIEYVRELLGGEEIEA